MGRKKTKAPAELLRINLRDKYGDTLLAPYRGYDLSAHHRFVDSNTIGELLLSFTLPLPHRTKADFVLESLDDGRNWHLYQGTKRFPPHSLGIFRFASGAKVAVLGAAETWRSFGDEFPWVGPFPVQAGDELAVDGLGLPNAFSAIMIQRGSHAGRIVIVMDYFLGQEGPDGQLVGSIYTDDVGQTWHTSRLFFPQDPLPFGPEGFGEPAVVELPSGWLWMVMRSLYGELWQCISRDGGRSWNNPTPTGLASPIANCYAKREPATGATVLCWNLARPGTATSFRDRHSLYRPRNNLVFAVSHDNTRTWTEPVVVEPGFGQYPTIHFADGRMYIMYQKSAEEFTPWSEMGLELVSYDLEEVLKLPPWTAETIQPYVDEGLVAHWRALACQHKSTATVE